MGVMRSETTEGWGGHCWNQVVGLPEEQEGATLASWSVWLFSPRLVTSIADGCTATTRGVDMPQLALSMAFS